MKRDLLEVAVSIVGLSSTKPYLSAHDIRQKRDDAREKNKKNNGDNVTDDKRYGCLVDIRHGGIRGCDTFHHKAEHAKGGCGQRDLDVDEHQYAEPDIIKPKGADHRHVDR